MPKQSRKRLRPPRRASTPQEAERELEPGNQARSRQLTAGADLAVVRDTARPLVERALLALHLEPRELGRLARFIEILERSRLPDEHREALVDKLRTDQATADAISAAVRAAFGDDGPELRDALIRSLEALERALGGEPSATSWPLPDGSHLDLGAEVLEGGASTQADALVGSLAEAVHAPLPQAARPESTSAAFIRLCRDLSLLLPWEEEEEEGGPAFE